MRHGLMERGKQTMKERDKDGRREGEGVIVGGQDGKWLLPPNERERWSRRAGRQRKTPSRLKDAEVQTPNSNCQLGDTRRLK